jgi:DNA-binding CsgD family transcriptional regulator
MNKQTDITEYGNGSCSYDDSAGGAVCLSELATNYLRRQAIAGRPDDKFLENTLLFDVNNGISLTKREGEILQLIVSGQTNKQIAQFLTRSERTVEFHRNRLMRKLGAHNAAELVKSAMAIGLV